VSELVSDGCSGRMSWTWRKVLRHEPPWEGCCETHDQLYEAGASRLQADLSLKRCVELCGHPNWALAMFVAVRCFGWMYWK
jgi:hypothetical protein